MKILFRGPAVNICTRLSDCQEYVKRLFGILFTLFIIMIVILFLLVSISQKASISTTIVLVVIPLAIRYIIYRPKVALHAIHCIGEWIAMDNSCLWPDFGRLSDA